MRFILWRSLCEDRIGVVPVCLRTSCQFRHSENREAIWSVYASYHVSELLSEVDDKSLLTGSKRGRLHSSNQGLLQSYLWPLGWKYRYGQYTLAPSQRPVLIPTSVPSSLPW